MQDLTICESGPQVVDSIGMGTVQFGKLFGNDLYRQVFELKRQGHDSFFEMGSMFISMATRGN